MSPNPSSKMYGCVGVFEAENTLVHGEAHARKALAKSFDQWSGAMSSFHIHLK